MRRFVLFTPTLALLIVLLVPGPALSALRVGTQNSETLTGTTGNDLLTGAEGNDRLKGLAGNDTYFFADGWGTDTLVEKPGEGADTLNFRGVRSGPVNVTLVREWDPAPEPMSAEGPGGSIDFSTSAGQAEIEQVIGGQADNDIIATGPGPHTLQPGGGATDVLTDYAGWNDGTGGYPELPVSNDRYKGFADNTGGDYVYDWGGTGDVVDLRPFSTKDVYISRRDFDNNGTEETLQIVTGPTAQVILAGHYGALSGTTETGQQGRIEKLIFADATVTSANGLAAATALSAKTTSGKQATLAEAADRLAEEARAQIAAMPVPGTRGDSGEGADKRGSKPAGEPAKPHKADTKSTPDAKAPRDKKQATKTKAPHETKHKQAKHGAQDRQRRQP